MSRRTPLVSRSLTNLQGLFDLNEAGFAPGTVRHWKSGDVKKTAKGDWVPHEPVSYTKKEKPTVHVGASPKERAAHVKATLKKMDVHPGNVEHWAKQKKFWANANALMGVGWEKHAPFEIPPPPPGVAVAPATPSEPAPKAPVAAPEPPAKPAAPSAAALAVKALAKQKAKAPPKTQTEPEKPKEKAVEPPAPAPAPPPPPMTTVAPPAPPKPTPPVAKAYHSPDFFFATGAKEAATDLGYTGEDGLRAAVVLTHLGNGTKVSEIAHWLSTTEGEAQAFVSEVQTKAKAAGYNVGHHTGHHAAVKKLPTAADPALAFMMTAASKITPEMPALSAYTPDHATVAAILHKLKDSEIDVATANSAQIVKAVKEVTGAKLPSAMSIVKSLRAAATVTGYKSAQGLFTSVAPSTATPAPAYPQRALNHGEQAALAKAIPSHALPAVFTLAQVLKGTKDGLTSSDLKTAAIQLGLSDNDYATALGHLQSKAFIKLDKANFYLAPDFSDAHAHKAGAKLPPKPPSKFHKAPLSTTDMAAISSVVGQNTPEWGHAAAIVGFLKGAGEKGLTTAELKTAMGSAGVSYEDFTKAYNALDQQSHFSYTDHDDGERIHFKGPTTAAAPKAAILDTPLAPGPLDLPDHNAKVPSIKPGTLGHLALAALHYHQGDLINAIVAVRAVSGISLKQAKDLVMAAQADATAAGVDLKTPLPPAYHAISALKAVKKFPKTSPEETATFALFAAKGDMNVALAKLKADGHGDDIVHALAVAADRATEMNLDVKLLKPPAAPVKVAPPSPPVAPAAPVTTVAAPATTTAAPAPTPKPKGKTPAEAGLHLKHFKPPLPGQTDVIEKAPKAPPHSPELEKVTTALGLPHDSYGAAAAHALIATGGVLGAVGYLKTYYGIGHGLAGVIAHKVKKAAQSAGVSLTQVELPPPEETPVMEPATATPPSEPEPEPVKAAPPPPPPPPPQSKPEPAPEPPPPPVAVAPSAPPSAALQTALKMFKLYGTTPEYQKSILGTKEVQDFFSTSFGGDWMSLVKAALASPTPEDAKPKKTKKKAPPATTAVSGQALPFQEIPKPLLNTLMAQGWGPSQTQAAVKILQALYATPAGVSPEQLLGHGKSQGVSDTDFDFAVMKLNQLKLVQSVADTNGNVVWAATGTAVAKPESAKTWEDVPAQGLAQTSNPEITKFVGALAMPQTQGNTEAAEEIIGALIGALPNTLTLQQLMSHSKAQFTTKAEFSTALNAISAVGALKIGVGGKPNAVKLDMGVLAKITDAEKTWDDIPALKLPYQLLPKETAANLGTMLKTLGLHPDAKSAAAELIWTLNAHPVGLTRQQLIGHLKAVPLDEPSFDDAMTALGGAGVIKKTGASYTLDVSNFGPATTTATSVTPALTTTAAKPELEPADSPVVQKLLTKLGIEPDSDLGEILRLAAKSQHTKATLLPLVKQLGHGEDDMEAALSAAEAVGYVSVADDGTITLGVPKKAKAKAKAGEPPPPAAPKPSAAKAIDISLLTVPDPDDLTYVGPAKDIGGAGHKEMYQDEKGQKWMFKLAVDKAGNLEKPYAAYAQQAFSQIARKVKPDHLPIGVVKLKGQIGTIQPYVPNDGNLAGVPPQGLTAVEMESVASEHIFDWMMSQHDSHGANLLRMSDGTVVGTDKEQGWRFFESTDEDLSVDYHPNKGENPPYYNLFWKAFRDNEIQFDPQSLLPYIEKIEAIKSLDFLAAVEPYSKSRKDWNEGERQVFLKLALSRKLGIRKDFEDFITKLYTTRTGENGKFTFDIGWQSAGTKSKPIIKTFDATQWAGELGIQVKPWKPTQGPEAGQADPTKVSLKVSNSEPDAKEKLENFLKDMKLTPLMMPVKGGVYWVSGVNKADFDKAKVQKSFKPEELKVTVAPTPATPKYYPEVYHPPEAAPNAEELKELQAHVLGALGKRFNIDGHAVEGTCARVKKFKPVGGSPYYLFHLKLRKPVWEKLKNSSSATAHTYAFPVATYDAKTDTFIEKNDHNDSAVGVRWADGESDAFLATDKHKWSYMGSLLLRVRPTGSESPLQAAQRVLNKMKPGLANDLLRASTKEEREVVKLSRLLWSVSPKEAFQLDESQRTLPELKKRLTAHGYDADKLQTVSEREVLQGYYAHVEPGRWKKLGKGKLRYLFNGIKTEAGVISVLQHGLLGIYERNLLGLPFFGGSPDEDVKTGSGDGILTRVVTESGFNEQVQSHAFHGCAQAIIAPDEADRHDTFMYLSDTFGRCRDDYGGWSSRSSVDSAMTTQSNSYSTGAEMSFRRGIDRRNILRIVCKDEATRKNLITLAKKAGVVEVNDVPIEDFIACESNLGAIFKKYVEPVYPKEKFST